MFGVATVLLLGGAVVVALLSIPGVGTGDVDPAGLTVGLVSLAASLWSGWIAVQALRWQETNISGNADRLAGKVMHAEREAWRQALGGNDRYINVQFVHQPAPTHEAADADRQGSLEDIAEYYGRLQPGRLVITGVPGAGKTVLALHLVIRLLEGRSAGGAVPMRLSLSSFDTSRSLEEWIARHLMTTYGVSEKAARALVQDRKVLPVLDGLDEMDAAPVLNYGSRAAQALRALNAYQQGVAKAQLVLTCRSTPYNTLQDAGEWVHDAARIELTPLDNTTARAFLANRVDNQRRWEDVLNTLSNAPTGPLAAGLSTPWRLTLAATVYEQHAPGGRYLLDPNALRDSTLNTPDAVGEHLLGLLIPAATTSHDVPYSPDRVRAWLTVLARYLNHNAARSESVGEQALPSTDIVLAELWPLAGLPRIRAAVTAVAAAIALAVIAVGLLWNPDFPPALAVLAGAGMLGLRAWVKPNGVKRWSPMSSPRLSGQHHLAREVVVDVAVGFVGFFAFGLLVVGLYGGLVAGLHAEFEADLEIRLVHGGVLGILFGLHLAGISLGGLGQPEREHPFLFPLMVGLTSGVLIFLSVLGGAFDFDYLPVSGLADGLAYGLEAGVQAGLGAGFGVAALLAFYSGEAGCWYVALLLSTRRGSGTWLPWRLGRFLDWCSHAGLLRKAGVAYQFRHRELQDFLAATDDTPHRQAARTSTTGP
ncbi:NACHT domain-containing protein [Streptomyces chartreusis]